MVQRWIVGVDGSLTSRSALDWAAHHCRARDAQIVALYAYPQPVTRRVLASVQRETGNEPGPTSIALHELDAAVSNLVAGEDVERQIVSDRATKALVEHADDADLLIVGHHETGGYRYQSLGSVSRYCVTHSRTPVVVVPSSWEPHDTERVIVGFDGSDTARAAVRWAAAFAAESTRLEALIALEVAAWLPSDVAQDRLAKELDAEEARLRSAIEDTDPDRRFEHEVAVRSVRSALAHAADYADLIVLGARGAGAIDGGALGSVSTWMLDVARCPLCIVPAVANRTESS